MRAGKWRVLLLLAFVLPALPSVKARAEGLPMTEELDFEEIQ